MVRNYLLFSIQYCYFILLVIRIKFDEASLFHEAQESSGRLSIVINCDTISFATSFDVTITTREYSGDPMTLSEDQSIATTDGDIIIL